MNPVDLMVEVINEGLLKVTLCSLAQHSFAPSDCVALDPEFSQIEPAPSQFVS